MTFDFHQAENVTKKTQKYKGFDFFNPETECEQLQED